MGIPLTHCPGLFSKLGSGGLLRAYSKRSIQIVYFCMHRLASWRRKPAVTERRDT